MERERKEELLNELAGLIQSQEGEFVIHVEWEKEEGDERDKPA